VHDRATPPTDRARYWWSVARIAATWLAADAVILFVLLATRVIGVTDMVGPGPHPDGKMRHEVELTFAGQIGYKFSEDDPGWFRPMCAGKCQP
jgi:hypothetical protein